MAAQTSFPENFHYVPEAEWTRCAFTVLRAGKVAASSGYGIRRGTHVGQDVLFCLSGAGAVEIGDQRVEVRPGQLVWIPNEGPHAHAADHERPWTLLWFRFDGPDAASIRTKLFGEDLPRTTIVDVAALAGWFERLFTVLRRRGRSLDLLLNQLVSEFFVLIDGARTAALAAGAADPLADALAVIRADIGRHWSADDLSSLLGLSTSQTRRLFHKQLRDSPRRWLVRERLIAAQALMIRDATPLSEIAEACGFCDVYHFGREFKRLVGASPAAWRRKELGLGVGRFGADDHMAG